MPASRYAPALEVGRRVQIGPVARDGDAVDEVASCPQEGPSALIGTGLTHGCPPQKRAHHDGVADLRAVSSDGDAAWSPRAHDEPDCVGQEVGHVDKDDGESSDRPSLFRGVDSKFERRPHPARRVGIDDRLPEARCGAWSHDGKDGIAPSREQRINRAVQQALPT